MQIRCRVLPPTRHRNNEAEDGHGILPPPAAFLCREREALSRTNRLEIQGEEGEIFQDFICPPSRPGIYRGVNKGLFVLLSRTQAGPGRTVKQEQEEISRNHVQTFIYPSVMVPLSHSSVPQPCHLLSRPAAAAPEYLWNYKRRLRRYLECVSNEPLAPPKPKGACM